MPSATQLDPPTDITAQQAAKLLSVSTKTVYRYIQEGVLSYRDIGLPGAIRPSYRLLLDEVQALVDRRQNRGWHNLNKAPRRTTSTSSLKKLKRLNLTRS